MLTTAQNLTGYRLNLNGANIGTCDDLLFDDQVWNIRYLVVGSGDVPATHRRLAPIRFIESLDHEDQTIKLRRSFEDNRIELIDRPPVSLHCSINIFRRIGMTFDWIDGALAAHVPKPCLILGTNAAEAEKLTRNNHLRSAAEMCTYSFEAPTLKAHVTDFIVDDENWSIKGMIVKERAFRLFSADEIYVSPEMIQSIEWVSSRVVAEAALTDEAQPVQLN